MAHPDHYFRPRPGATLSTLAITPTYKIASDVVR